MIQFGVKKLDAERGGRRPERIADLGMIFKKDV